MPRPSTRTPHPSPHLDYPRLHSPPYAYGWALVQAPQEISAPPLREDRPDHIVRKQTLWRGGIYFLTWEEKLTDPIQNGTINSGNLTAIVLPALFVISANSISGKSRYNTIRV